MHIANGCIHALHDAPYTQYSTNQHSLTHLENRQIEKQCAVCELQPEHVKITHKHIRYKKVTYKEHKARYYPIIC